MNGIRHAKGVKCWRVRVAAAHNDFPRDVLLSRVAALDEQFGSVVLLPLTQTMLTKSIMDAVAPLRALLQRAGVHVFENQGLGPTNKVVVPTTVIAPDDSGVPSVRETETSLYRPQTKQGDPRLWVGRLAQSALPEDVIAVGVDFKGHLVVVVVTAQPPLLGGSDLYWTQATQLLHGFSPAALVERSRDLDSLVARLEDVRAGGWLLAVCEGDTAVGRTLETALGIAINSSKKPDWGGIELKFGRPRPTQRKNLFAQVPDWELSPLKSSSEILDAFGYVKDGVDRLYVEVGANPNSRGLFLGVDAAGGLVRELSTNPSCPVAAVWRLQKLLDRMVEKHSETLWVTCETRQGVSGEEFLPTQVIHTSGPRLDRFPILIESGDITVDHLIKRVPGKSAQEKGPIWKVTASGHPSLFGGMRAFSLAA